VILRPATGFHSRSASLPETGLRFQGDMMVIAKPGTCHCAISKTRHPSSFPTSLSPFHFLSTASPFSFSSFLGLQAPAHNQFLPGCKVYVSDCWQRNAVGINIRRLTFTAKFEERHVYLILPPHRTYHLYPPSSPPVLVFVPSRSGAPTFNLNTSFTIPSCSSSYSTFHSILAFPHRLPRYHEKFCVFCPGAQE
jgi:hypothetical protein